MSRSAVQLCWVYSTALICLFLLQHSCIAQVNSSDSVYHAAQGIYTDDKTAPLAPQIVSSGHFPECTWQKITYHGKSGRVPALLFLPTQHVGKPPATIPCLLLLHGLGGSKEQLIPVARFLASIGYASWAIDDVGSGERKPAKVDEPKVATIKDLETLVSEESEITVVDQRRGLDYLDCRPELDHHKFGLMGFSLGALLGGVLAPIDFRIKAAILVSGGGDLGKIMVGEAKDNLAFGKLYPQLLANADPVELEQSLALIDPVNFVAHLAPRPLLMEEGRLDKVITPAAAEILFDAAKQPKQIDWYADAGHIPPAADIFPAISVFLDKYLPLPGR